VRVPEGKLARVTSIEMLLDFLAGSVGPALGGLLIESRGTEFSVWVLLAMSAMIAIPALRMKVPEMDLPTRRKKVRVVEPPGSARAVHDLISDSSDGPRVMWEPAAHRAVNAEALSPSGQPRPTFR
jgi:hypothetical protein